MSLALGTDVKLPMHKPGSFYEVGVALSNSRTANDNVALDSIFEAMSRVIRETMVRADSGRTGILPEGLKVETQVPTDEGERQTREHRSKLEAIVTDTIKSLPVHPANTDAVSLFCEYLPAINQGGDAIGPSVSCRILALEGLQFAPHVLDAYRQHRESLTAKRKARTPRPGGRRKTPSEPPDDPK